VHEEDWLAITIGTILIMFVLALSVGQWLHHRHIYWLPESAATILIGLLFGLIVWYMDYEKEFPFFEQDVTPGLKNMLAFDPEFFTLFLLPPIIFEAGYSFRIYKRNLGRILILALVGTIFATAATWLGMHFLGRAGLMHELNVTESGQFAALISAVDPVATLSVFNALRVDPTLNNIVVGESVLNDAVALIAFRSISHYGVSLPDEASSVVLSFLMISACSVAIGVAVALLCAGFLRLLGMGRSGDLPHIEACIFWAFAYGSFVCAEVPENSGIVAAMFCGITMQRFAKPHLSAAAKLYVEHIIKLLCCICDTFIYLLVGMALVLEVSWASDEGAGLAEEVQMFVCVMGLCLVARLCHVFSLLGLCNLFTETKVPCNFQIVIWFGGLRGAIAVALATEVVGTNAHLVRACTMLIVVFTTFVFGGSTKCLLDALKVPLGCSEDDEDEDRGVRPLVAPADVTMTSSAGDGPRMSAESPSSGYVAVN